MTLQSWKGHSAIVTGGASGLGAGAAARLSADGLKVTLFDLNEDLGQAHAQAIGGQFQRVDVADPASVAAGVAAVGAPRVLVNCAGIASVGKTVSRGAPHDAALFAKTIQINLIGSFLCASIAAAAMAAEDPIDDDGTRGVIINTASVAAYDGQIGQVAYAASKGGIAGMTLPMARDLADKGVRGCVYRPWAVSDPASERSA